MARVKGGPRAHARHKKIVKMAKGSRGRAKNCFTVANQRVEKNMQYAYRDRKARKGQFRALWIQRINAGVRSLGMTYSRFINGLLKANCEVDRKILAELAVNNKEAFKVLVERAQKALA